MPGADVDPEEALAYGLFSRGQARAAGVSPREIARRLRVARWRRLEYGIYEDVGRTSRDGDPVVRGLLRAGPQSVASHLTAAHALGWDLLKDPPLQFTVARNNGTAESKDATIFRRDLSAEEVGTVGVLRVTNPVRTAIDLAAAADLVEAVVAVDSALRLRHLTIGELESAARTRREMQQSRRVFRVVSLVDPGSGSVPESVSRFLFRNAGLPLPHTQYVIRTDNGTFIARADFAWPDVWLVVEIDGFAFHSSESAFQSDHDRQNELELAGWTVLRFTAKDVRNHPEKITDTVGRALRLRGI